MNWDGNYCAANEPAPRTWAGGGRSNASSSVVSFGAVFDTTGSYVFHAAEGMKHALLIVSNTWHARSVPPDAKK
jgi:hypothetical protein